MNKKYLVIFPILIGLFLMQGCAEESIGKRATRNYIDQTGMNNELDEDTRYIAERLRYISFDTNGRRVNLNAKVNNGSTLSSNIFYCDNNQIKLGSDDDEPMIVNEGAIVTAEDVGEEDLDGMEGIRFIYDFDGISHLIKITNFDILNNKSSFYVFDTDTGYEDFEYIDSEPTRFDFLEDNFTLIFNINNASITFNDINDQTRDHISKIRTDSGGILKLS